MTRDFCTKMLRCIGDVAKQSPRTEFIQAYCEAWRIVQRLIHTHTHTHTPTLLKIVQRNDSEEVGKEGKEEGRKKVRKVVERKRSKSTCPGDRSLKIFLHLVRDFTSLDFTNNRLLLYYYTSLRNYHSSLIFLF